VRRWHVGDVTIVRIESVELTLPSERPVPEWAVPHLAPSTDAYHLAFSGFGIVDGDRRIVVDPWLADDNPRSAPDAGERVDGLLSRLAAAGLPAGEVDVVVNTHIDGTGWNTRPASRPDGDGWVATFPNARYLIPEAEIAAIERGDPIFGADGLAPLFDACVVDPVDASAEPVPVSRHVTLDPAPGHNFGHVAVRVDAAEDGVAVIPGHLFLDLFSVEDPSSREGDGPEAPDTRRRLLDLLAARSGLLLSPFFGGEGAGRVEGDATTGYRLGPPATPT
jgi:hypothetical protein